MCSSELPCEFALDAVAHLAGDPVLVATVLHRDADVDARPTLKPRPASGRPVATASAVVIVIVGELLNRLGGECGHCKQLAEQRVAHNDGVALEDAIANRWSPKTQMAIRSIPFGFSGRVEIVIERYFDEFSEWMYTGQSINRRLNWLRDGVDGIDRLHPHSLRATAATHHAGRGLNTLSLQAMFGWAQPSTAQAYIASLTDNLDRQLQFVHQ